MAGVFERLYNNNPDNQGKSPRVKGVLKWDDDFASKVNAQLAREDWADYKATYVPIHNTFKNAVMSDQLTNEQLARVPQNINNAFAQQQASADNRMSRMGLADADLGRTDAAKALAQTGAENNIRTSGRDRRLAAMTGAPLPTTGG